MSTTPAAPNSALEELLRIADHAYGDGLISDYATGVERFDTLALFIVRELRDTFEPNDPYTAANDALETAREELQSVIDALTGVQLERTATTTPT